MEELEKIYLYIRNNFNEPKIAEKIVKNIKGKISNLKYFPLANKLLRKTKNFEYRKFVIKNYIIIYKINFEEKEINILHIYNQKQKVRNQKLHIEV